MTNPIPGETIVSEVAARYGFDPDEAPLLRNATNPIYRVRLSGKSGFMRLSPAEKRPLSKIIGEVEWMNYLRQNAIGTAEILPSRSGHLVEAINNGTEQWHAVIFEEVSGVHPERELLSEAVIRHWGQTVGKMHRLAQTFRPSVPEAKRPHWHELEVFNIAQRMPEAFRAEQTAVLEAWAEMARLLSRLPTPASAYNLIHADLEPANMLLENGRLTLIDFEECCYCWFTFDLAVSLMYAVLASWQYDIMEIGNPENDRYVQQVWDLLLAGYRQENSLDDEWLEAMPTFLRFRVMQDYVHNLRQLANGSTEEWLLAFLDQQRCTIEANTTFSHIRWL